MTTTVQDGYQRAAAIADKVLAAGLPLIGFEAWGSEGGLLMFRFGGVRAQTVHMDTADADAPKLIAAYLKAPP
jgi:hypothetical protein